MLVLTDENDSAIYNLFAFERSLLNFQVLRMSNEIELIKSIDSLSLRITFLSGFLIFVYLSVVAAGIISYIKNSSNNGPLGDANAIYESGDYDLLIERCVELLKTKPNNFEANWFLALCYYQKQNYGKALKQFNEVSRINPAWESETLPYVNKINSKHDNSQSHH